MACKLRKALLVWVIMLLIAFLALTGQAETAPTAEELVELWPRMDGSTATQPLTNALYSYFTGMPASADAPAIVHRKTYTAYERLFAIEEWAKEDPVDLIFVTAPYAEELARMNEGYEMVPVVKDALVFLNHQQNPVADLSSEQLRRIYTGEITDWQELGGQSGPICAYQRPTESGSQTLFMNLLMREMSPMEAPAEWYIGDMGGLVDAVAAYNNAGHALGYNMYYYIANMYSDWRVRMMAVDGVAPSDESIASDQYALTTAYYAVYPKALPAEHPARRLVAWLLSDEGQQAAQSAGYVPLRPLPASSMGDAASEAARPMHPGTARQGNRWNEPLRMERWPVMSQRENDDGTVVLEELAAYHAYARWPLAAIFPEAPALEAEINLWLAQTRQELTAAYDMREEDAEESCRMVETADVWANLLTLSVAVDNADFDTMDRRYAVFDLKHQRRLQLSDLFYEGVDYMGYINDCLVPLSFGATDKYGLYHTSVDPAYPFDGVSPQVEFGFRGWGCDRWLHLALESDARFSGVSWQDLPDRVNPPVPIWHDISPFGGCKVEMQFSQPLVPLAEHFMLIPKVVSVDNGKRPEAENALREEIERATALMYDPTFQAVIDEKAKRMADSIRSYAPSATFDEKGAILPEIEQFGRYLSIGYSLSVGDINTTLWWQVFDLHTGRSICQLEQVWDALAGPDAQYWEEGFLGQGTWTAIKEGVVPEDNTLFDSWLSVEDTETHVALRVIAPQGKTVRLRVPMHVFAPPDPRDFD